MYSEKQLYKDDSTSFPPVLIVSRWRRLYHGGSSLLLSWADPRMVPSFIECRWESLLLHMCVSPCSRGDAHLWMNKGPFVPYHPQQWARSLVWCIHSWLGDQPAYKESLSSRGWYRAIETWWEEAAASQGRVLPWTCASIVMRRGCSELVRFVAMHMFTT